MKAGQRKTWAVKGLIGATLLASLLVWLTGCWLFNIPPTASFTASATVTTAGSTIAFSAILSYDEDGIIVKYEWDFGDGSSASGQSVTHTYGTAGTFMVVLRVTDDNGATATAQKTITVNPAPADGGTGGTGPTASFTATPLTGASPLTVTFNASASTYAGHAITAYFWNFGDGTTGTGITTTHTYAPSTTTSYNVVLRIIASDYTEGTATKTITATTTSPTPPSNAPTASFTANPTTALAPGTIAFNPAASKAGAGRTLSGFHWTFGDGGTAYSDSAQEVTHTYYTPLTSQNFTVTLRVFDDLNQSATYSRTVTIKDWQPVAGFEMKKTAPAPAGDWGVVEIKIYSVGTDVQTVSFRSVAPDAWTTPVPKGEGAKPTNFETDPYTTGNKNLSYDPEGQSPANGWGITTYIWNFDGGLNAAGHGSETIPAQVDGSCAAFDVGFKLTAQEQMRTFNVRLTVIDAQGAQSTLTRKVTLYKGAAPT